ncbi:hypothetical protein [Streptomyces achromogenes]|uniref:hypothetical protein n=1 Tax=Streptomyces achromogenes TaxID=67255 RepID=UPI003A80D5F8
MLDVLVARTAGSGAGLRAFAAQRRMAVVNAMSAAEHPPSCSPTSPRCSAGSGGGSRACGCSMSARATTPPRR